MTTLRVVIALAVVLIASLARAEAPELIKLSSRHYTVHTNLTPAEVRDWAMHMDLVFREYANRFRSFNVRNRASSDLYLFKTQQDYLDFLTSRGIDGTNSGGMFVVRGSFAGLLTWTSAKSKAATLQTLQHEGFHQFAWNYMGHGLPIWVNEGLAQYFEDGILVRGRMSVGMVNAMRAATVKAALAENRTIDFNRMLTMTNEEWSRDLQRNADVAAINYAQSWSVCYFLIHAENGKYRPAFERYLTLVASGRPSDQVFRNVFGNDVAPFRRKWQTWAEQVKPDPLTDAIQKMEFLGQALKSLAKRNIDPPRSIDSLEQTLRSINFRAWSESSGIRQEFDARDDASYTYINAAGNRLKFDLLEPTRSDLPPRITARGLKPEPTLVWSRNDDEELVQEIEFR